MALGPIFITLLPSLLAWNLMTFQGDMAVTPDSGNLRSRALVTTMPGFLKPILQVWSLETELRVHSIHDTWETGLQIVLRSLVAPLKKRRAHYVIRMFKLYFLSVWTLRVENQFRSSVCIFLRCRRDMFSTQDRKMRSSKKRPACANFHKQSQQVFDIKTNSLLEGP